MRTVELVPGVRSSVLGFGCAPVMGAVGADTARWAIATALDLGVNHFDIARSYGYGEAEQFLGRLLAGRREEVVIASKFGIRATWRARLLQPFKPLVRALRSARGANGPPAVAPDSSPPQAARRDLFHERVPLTPEVMKRSLESSLKALRREQIDIYFLHEPPERPVLADDLCATAQVLKQQGKIRAWGLATSWSSRRMFADDLNRFDVLQFDASPAAPDYASATAERGGEPNVIFSALRHRGALEPAAVMQRLWSDFPRSVVLVSMFSPAHIRANAAAAD